MEFHPVLRVNMHDLEISCCKKRARGSRLQGIVTSTWQDHRNSAEWSPFSLLTCHMSQASGVHERGMPHGVYIYIYIDEVAGSLALVPVRQFRGHIHTWDSCLRRICWIALPCSNKVLPCIALHCTLLVLGCLVAWWLGRLVGWVGWLPWLANRGPAGCRLARLRYLVTVRALEHGQV